ncbi:hypothetical protein HK414_27525 [Ramlibacter terrae]|uniref:Glycosyltransferase RgtA/B/C/D-like domain-containing protein n=1 Tax=Ramlibacter terrae TaxID=2732511 RepID=A0ABX6P840_9BURK|nr:hypothetical protein HK414_27525 [Ramlibacter terrae]
MAQETDTRRTFVVFAVLPVAAAWLLARPYIGLRHDGELYRAVMLHLRPEVLSQDLFFQFGSQDRYTIVAPLLATLYRHFGMGESQMVLIAPGQLAVLWAALLLLRRWGVDAIGCTLGVAAICVMSHNYGGWNIFSFSERFVTGRVFAEPLALAALVAIERRRARLGLAALAAAMLFHPLVAIPVVVFAWGVLVARDRRWAWALVGVPVVVALALAGIPPFAALLQTFDAKWLEAVQKANGQVLVLSWPREDWVTLFFDCAVVWAASRLFPAGKLLLRVAVIATLALVAISAVGADLLHNVLLTQVQVWRAHWVTHLLSLAFLPVVLWRTLNRDDLRSQILVLSVMALAVATNVRYDSGTMLAVWTALALWLYASQSPVEMRLLKAARLATGIALVGTAVLVLVATAGQLYAARGNTLSPSNILLLLMTMPVLSLPLMFVLLRAQRRGGAAAAGALALVVAGIAFATAHWDQRPVWTRYIESHLFQQHPFEKIIGPTQQVLWWEQLAAVWAVLHRPSYYSGQQGAGLLFNRETALEHRRRGGVTGVIQMQRDACDVMRAVGFNADPNIPCWPTESAVEHVCSAPAGPDFIILDRPLMRGVVAKWSPELGTGSNPTYYLHDCKQIR